MTGRASKYRSNTGNSVRSKHTRRAGPAAQELSHGFGRVGLFDQFGAIKAWMGASHFKMKTMKHVATEMALHILACYVTRVIAIPSVPAMIKAMRA